MTWYERTGQYSAQLGATGLVNMSDLAPEVASATTDDPHNPIGEGISTGLRFVWNTTIALGEWYNRRVYQPYVDDPLVFANLALAAPFYRKPDQSLGDYMNAAWQSRDDVSLGQANVSKIVGLGQKVAGDRGLDPVANPAGYQQGTSELNFATGVNDFAAALTADPLNWTGGPVRAVTTGLTAPRVVADAERAHSAAMTAMGKISQTRVNELLDAGKMDGVLRRFTEITDPMVARQYAKELRLGSDDPDTLGFLASQIDDVERQKDLFSIVLNPRSPDAQEAALRIKGQYGADIGYFVQRHAGDDPLAPEMFGAVDDLALGPQTQELAHAVVSKADEANAGALARTEAFARGIDKMLDSPTTLVAAAPTRNPLFEYAAWRRTARRMRTISNDPIVSTYQPHRWHPPVWYVEKPSGLVEPDSPTAFAEIDASIRQLNKLTGGDFVESGRADEFVARWFAAGTLAEPATARSKVAAGLNDYAVNKLLKQHHKQGLTDEQIQAITDTISTKAAKANDEIRRKGWLSATTDEGNIGIIRHPLLQRATPNAVAMYDFQALNRAIRKFDTPGIASLATAAMEGTTEAADALMGVWKVGVLMRLGYTIRNLTEATMSLAATGNLGNILAEVGPDRMRSWMQATTRGGARQIDRIGVAGGILDEPQALWDQRQAWDGVRAATDASANRVLENLSAVNVRKLARSADPEKREAARRLESIRVELRSKGVTYHATTAKAPTTAEAAEMGNLAEGAGKWRPAKNRALSTTPSASLARHRGEAHTVTSYGETFDFTQGATGSFDRALVSAAKGGDREAAQRLSDAAYSRGYGRIILPDSDEWGGRQVLVNQRAVGNDGAKRVVDNRIRRLIAEADEQVPTPKISPEPPATRAKNRRRATKQRALGKTVAIPVNPDFEDDLLRSMLDNGIEGFALKLADRRVALDAQTDFLSSRLASARRRKARTAPLRSQGKGFQQGTSDVVSHYGYRYENAPDVFATESGGMWERALSGDPTYSVLAGDSYYGALHQGSMVSKVVQPDNPRYFEAWANILNLHFRDHQSARVDQVVWKALSGESFDDILDWATGTPEGYQWARGLGITKVGDGARPAIPRKIDLEEEADVEKAVASLMSAVDLYLPRGPVREAFQAGGDIDQDLLRMATQGSDLPPLQALLIPTSAEAARDLNLRQRFMRNGVARAMKVLGSIPESSWARHPLFAAEYNRQRRSLLSLAEEAGGGRVTADDWAKIELQAKRRAQQTVESTLFTLTRRSSVSGNAAVRTLFPFVAAYENVLQRWGRFVKADPMIPVRFSNYAAKFNAGVTIVDGSGAEVESAKDWPDDAVMILPGLDALHLPGSLGRTARLLATETHVPIKSLDVLTQGQPLNPGLGPFAVLPIAELVRRRPSAEQYFQWAMPYGVPESNYDVFLPTAGKRAMQLWTDSSVVTNTISKAWLIANYEHETKGTPLPTFEEIEQTATSMQFLRGVLAMSAPFATSLTNERDWYAGKLREYQGLYGYDEGETRFFLDFPGVGKLVESLSRNPSGVRAATAAVDNAKKYRSEIAQAYGEGDPQVAGFIMNYGVPDDVTFSQAAYQWQRSNAPVRGSKDTYRQVGNPEDQVREANVREGWRLYREVVDGVKAQMQLQGWEPGDREYSAVLTLARKKVSSYIYREQGNEVWYQEYINPDTAKYMRRAGSFKSLLMNTKFADEHASDTLIQSMRAFLAGRDLLVAELARRKAAGGAGSLAAEANAGLREAYEADVERLQMESPEFREWHFRFFENDSVTA